MATQRLGEQSMDRATTADAAVRPGHASYVVGIGASTGGLAALRRFFAQVPPDTGLSFVVVVHLAPNHDSLLPALLEPHCAIPVQQVSETTPLERDCVYIIPPNANLDAVDTHLRLSPLEARRRDRHPIDHFFRTLAETHDGLGVAVVMTGDGADGSLGVRCIREAGGLTLAQLPEEAEEASMPRSAIATGMIDAALTVEDMPAAIVDFCRTEPRLPFSADSALMPAQQRSIDAIAQLLHARTDVDVGAYEQNMLLRRVRRRMKLHTLVEFEEYVALLREEPDEAAGLVKDIAINITEFFRGEVFARFEKTIVPALIRHAESRRPRVRIWSVGCSTGEEAYSLAMLLIEQARERGLDLDFQIFATDLSKDVVLRARAGCYPEGIAANVSPQRLQRFFVFENDRYCVRREVNDRIVFAQHNLVRDPPFMHLDVVVCRNLLVDFEVGVRREALEIFHFALDDNGFLVLGETESAPDCALFSRDDDAASLYRKVEADQRKPSRHTYSRVFGAGNFARTRPARDAHQGVYRYLLERAIPPSLGQVGSRRFRRVREHRVRWCRLGARPSWMRG
jgi:two-component system CheB/CheR fusion protein